ncbi:hypothetical protein HYX13_02660 [Candidatus Woesearchaeota archaeon]|nr:hypothetical protein [Candidatus Woesearchaeota archaeon]
MELNNQYQTLFGKMPIPIFGMIHLAGDVPVKRALEELALFEEESVDAAIIENYHGSIGDVEQTLLEIRLRTSKIVLGVNILPNQYFLSFDFAKRYGACFIQLDHISGIYTNGMLLEGLYRQYKEKHSDTFVLGGVWPKYYSPLPGSDLEKDLCEGVRRAEAIVVTGAGTGKETPLEKIKKFREVIGEHPLVVGAGLTPENAYKQLSIADGGIVGSSLKIGNQTYNPVDRIKVRDFMDVVKEVRKEK